jgi:hypothetical protein
LEKDLSQSHSTTSHINMGEAQLASRKVPVRLEKRGELSVIELGTR